MTTDQCLPLSPQLKGGGEVRSWSRSLIDSIHSNSPEHLFKSVRNHECVKQEEYQLSNIDKYSDQFEYTDVVIISMGKNDLSGYGHEYIQRGGDPKLGQELWEYPYIIPCILLTFAKYHLKTFCKRDNNSNI